VEPGRVYELGGDHAFTLTALATEISALAGQHISYRDLPVDDYTQPLTGAGIPGPVAAILADSDRGLASGDLYVDSGHLVELISRPTTSLHDALHDALR